MSSLRRVNRRPSISVGKDNPLAAAAGPLKCRSEIEGLACACEAQGGCAHAAQDFCGRFLRRMALRVRILPPGWVNVVLVGVPWCVAWFMGRWNGVVRVCVCSLGWTWPVAFAWEGKEGGGVRSAWRSSASV